MQIRRDASPAARAARAERQATWKRRRITIPSMLGATAAAIVLAPLLLPVAAVRDLVRGKRALPTVRGYLFALQYVVNDSIEIVAAGPLWMAAGFGRRLDGDASQRRHERLQAWSIRVLHRRAERLLGIRLDLPSDVDDVLGPGPAIVVCRHVSLFDASLPAVLYQRLGFHTRGVVMAELLSDPGFDLLYQRAGSVFVARDHDPAAASLAARVAARLGPRTVGVVFPEGRLARPELIGPAQPWAAREHGTGPSGSPLRCATSCHRARAA
ncbi:MAG: 1-acyl-sn-glycerol-3-phosphate acyltransferase [Ilumatobacteraceae bacterium]